MLFKTCILVSLTLCLIGCQGVNTPGPDIVDNSNTSPADNNTLPPATNGSGENPATGGLTQLNDAEKEIITETIRPSIDTREAVLAEVDKLQKEGVIKDVLIMESFPEQISVTGPRGIINTLNMLASEENKVISSLLTATESSQTRLKEQLEMLSEQGLVESFSAREDNPMQFEVTASARVIGDLREITGESTGNELITMYINSEQVECVGVAPQMCLQTRESEADDWTFFYDSIDGFEFEAGFTYVLKVIKTEKAITPADSSSLDYKLLEVVSKEAA